MRRQHRTARHCDRIVAILTAHHRSDLLWCDIGIKIERKAICPASGNCASQRAASIVDIGLGSQAVEAEPTIFKATGAEVGIDCRVAIGKTPSGGYISASNADRGPTAEHRIARAEIHRKANRAPTLRPEIDRPVNPAPRQPQIARNTFIPQRQRAGDIGTINVQPVDRYPGWRVFRQK